MTKFINQKQYKAQLKKKIQLNQRIVSLKIIELIYSNNNKY